MEMREIKDKYNNGSNDTSNTNNTSFGRFKVKEKLFKYCWKCSKQLPEGSETPWCDWECKKEYYSELAQDMDDIVGIN